MGSRAVEGFNNINRTYERDRLFQDLMLCVMKYDNRLPTYDKVFVVGIVRKKIVERGSK